MDYITKFFEINDISKIFTITGGFAMFLNDSFGKNKKFDIYLVVPDKNKVLVESMVMCIL